MKKIILLISLFFLLLMTGCGTVMEKRTKTITINSRTPVKAYSDGTKYIGEGQFITYEASNRSHHGDEFITLREIGNENNVRTVSIEREFNTWSLWNLLWYGVPYIIDLPTGGTSRLARLNYSIPDFSGDYSTNNNYSSASRNSNEPTTQELKAELERMKLKNEIKRELELERTKERLTRVEANQ